MYNKQFCPVPMKSVAFVFYCFLITDVTKYLINFPVPTILLYRVSTVHALDGYISNILREVLGTVVQ